MEEATLALLALIVAPVVGYLIGSVPNGVFIGRLYGVDPRKVGSGRTGGTNVYRAAGPKAGLLTAFADAMKGLVVVVLARSLFSGVPLAVALAGLAAVVGHNWSIFLKFRGGAGTMTNLGVLLGLSPVALLVAAICGLGALILSRMASVGSLTAAWAAFMALVVLGAIGRLPIPFALYGIGQAIIITWALRPNIKRILEGTERRIGQPE